MNVIETGQDYFGMTLADCVRYGTLALLARRAGITLPPVPAGLPAYGPVQAFVNAGRWVAACPDCAGEISVSYVWPETPVFFCGRCFNAATNGAWRPVEMPDAGTREAIETVLLQRPLQETRNWRPSETIDDLLRENEEHGLIGVS